MESLQQFLEMGGYGQFVWPCYGIASVVLITLLVVSLRELRASEAALARLETTTPQNSERGE